MDRVRGRLTWPACFPGCASSGWISLRKAVEYARAHYQRANLCYQQGDIADPLFAPGSVDGILNSSVWHRLTSFNGFPIAKSSGRFVTMRKRCAQVACSSSVTLWCRVFPLRSGSICQATMELATEL